MPAGNLTYLCYSGELPAETWCYATSNGLSAGTSTDRAVLGGLYELIECDGYLLTWMNRLPATRIDLGTAVGAAAVIRDHYRRTGIDLHVSTSGPTSMSRR